MEDVIERRLYKIMNVVNSWCIVFLFMMIISGCSNTNYQFGDISKKVSSITDSYCSTENIEIKALLKVTLTNYGVKVDTGYCLARDVVKAVL